MDTRINNGLDAFNQNAPQETDCLSMAASLPACLPVRPLEQTMCIAYFDIIPFWIRLRACSPIIPRRIWLYYFSLAFCGRMISVRDTRGGLPHII